MAMQLVDLMVSQLTTGDTMYAWGRGVAWCPTIASPMTTIIDCWKHCHDFPCGVGMVPSKETPRKVFGGGVNGSRTP